jgi:hypothetical protein
MLKANHTFSLIVATSLLAFTACQPADYQGPATIIPRMDLAPEETERYRELLIGKWYREQPRSDGTTVRSLSTMNSDGMERIEFQIIYKDGTISESLEVLNWGVSGDIYFTILRELVFDGEPEDVSPERPGNYLAYRVLKLTEEEFEYQTIVTGNVFQARRVAGDFELPRVRRAK